MKRFTPLALSLLLAAAACNDDVPMVMDDAGPTDDAGTAFVDCEASDQAFVRNAYLAFLGHRTRSQAEVMVYADMMAEVRALGEPADADAGPVVDAPDPKAVVARAILDNPAYVDRWASHFMDALRVARIEEQSMRTCYGDSQRDITDGSLATYVRDNAGSATGDGGGQFTMLDLLRSSLLLDDISPTYRGHLYALVSRAIPAANVPQIQAELARREDFGLVFDSAYLNRDIVCLGCHNSSGSTTFNPDPALNRHWALPGHFETSLYGDPTGTEPARAHAPFRYDGFVADIFQGNIGDSRPWDWDTSCGGFYTDGYQADPAAVDGLFGTLTGDRTTVYDLEASLQRGFDSIRANGLIVGDDGSIADPDTAFAYLVSASIVNSVWTEVIGSSLTIANYFPRNQESRDLLFDLTENFVANSFSVRELLVDIVSTPYFNRPPPEAGCDEPYNMPPVFDPWVIGDDDPERRKNGTGDSVAALSSRALMSAAYAALEWPLPFFIAFPAEPRSIGICDQFYTCAEMDSMCAADGSCCTAHEYLCASPPGPGDPTADESRSFQRGIGVFLKNGERGFRGLDFQARLVWEDRFGACNKPRSADDFINKLATAATADDVLLGDAVAALKDRLVGEARVYHEPGPAGVSEIAAIQSMFTADLADPVSTVTDLEGGLRELCGVLMSSPQFLLGGLTAPDSEYIPLLTPAEFGFETICTTVAGRGLSDGLTLSCAADSVSVTR
jgi:hypothetical protein